MRILRFGAIAAMLAGWFVVPPPSLAGEFNKVLSVGSAAPIWGPLPATDGKNYSSTDFAGQITVVIFTCNSCPVAVAYEDRILALAKALQGEARIVAINSNTIPADQMPAMIQRATKKQFPFPYLHDATQQVAKAFGANYTPEFFVLDAAGKVVYFGALDDRSPPLEATTSHVPLAVKAAQQNRPAPVGETLARGCRIRFVVAKPSDD